MCNELCIDDHVSFSGELGGTYSGIVLDIFNDGKVRIDVDGILSQKDVFRDVQDLGLAAPYKYHD